MSALDTAEFWIGYVIRNGAETLHVPGHNLPWWKLSLLDVYGFISFVILFFIFFIYKLCKFIIYLSLKILFIRHDEKQSKKKK